MPPQPSLFLTAPALGRHEKDSRESRHRFHWDTIAKLGSLAFPKPRQPGGASVFALWPFSWIF